MNPFEGKSGPYLIDRRRAWPKYWLVLREPVRWSADGRRRETGSLARVPELRNRSERGQRPWEAASPLMETWHRCSVGVTGWAREVSTLQVSYVQREESPGWGEVHFLIECPKGIIKECLVESLQDDPLVISRSEMSLVGSRASLQDLGKPTKVSQGVTSPGDESRTIRDTDRNT